MKTKTEYQSTCPAGYVREDVNRRRFYIYDNANVLKAHVQAHKMANIKRHMAQLSEMCCCFQNNTLSFSRDYGLIIYCVTII